MKEKVEGWKGVSQGAYVDDFHDEGIALEGVFIHPSMMLSALPGIGRKHKELAGKFIETMAAYKKVEDMINLGAYKEGTNPRVDYAIKMIDKLRAYLKQGMQERRDFADSVQGLYFLFEGAEGKA